MRHAYQSIATPIIPEEPAVLDENTPKSSPKNPKDQYIRKRMIIAGASYCDNAVLARLTVGTYLDVVAEPDNPHDKNAVKLLFDGEKVGYIPKKDNLPFVTSLKLGRKVYGVVTDVFINDSRAEYEFETWFDRA